MSQTVEQWCSLGLGDGRVLEISSYIFTDGYKKHICSFNHHPKRIFMHTEEIYKILKEVDYPDDEIPEYLMVN